MWILYTCLVRGPCRKTIIDKIKTIKGAKFNGNKKLWSIPLELEDELLSIFRQSQISYDFVAKQDEKKTNEVKGVITSLKDDDFLNEKISQNFDYLKILAKCDKKMINSILNGANKDLIHSLCECIYNILKGNVELTERNKTQLIKHKNSLRKLLTKNSIKEKKKIPIQKGGFLQILLPSVISGLATILDDQNSVDEEVRSVKNEYDEFQDQNTYDWIKEESLTPFSAGLRGFSNMLNKTLKNYNQSNNFTPGNISMNETNNDLSDFTLRDNSLNNSRYSNKDP
ncbi:unnamed protein product [Brachionus calyciflorus]|uniref:Uncharacterized protein n=1 Tax=Brachionus calyciflorus TaxID=104777 RepID=A0A814PPR5_9BILA|nr:unnamed protein product [Brachionus calyciflorus]